MERERIRDDLRGLVQGEVRADDISLQLYASDASIYQIKPLVVVRPKGLADVVACVQYAAENRLPIHPRGSGTGLAGAALGSGLVLDFSRFMQRVLRDEGDHVRVQPGLVHAKLNDHLRLRGRHFGPDPAMSSVTTMGGVLSVDSGGSHWLKYGSARRHVVSLQVVLADGQVLEVGKEQLHGEGFDPQSRRGRLVSDIATLIERNSNLIQQRQPKSLVNCCGYQLSDVLDGERLDLAKLIVGSEGTLALITEATLATQPLPRHRAASLLLFDRLESAARAVTEILPLFPSACDLMDRRHLSLARECTAEYDQMFPPETEAVLLVEHEGDQLTEVRDRVNQVVDRVRRKRRLAFHAIQSQDKSELDLFWRLARNVVPTLYRLKGTTRPLPFVEDFAVPPRALPDFLVKMQNVLKQHHVIASMFSHAGHGQIHLRPFLDLSNPADLSRMAQLAADLYQEVIAVGGTISGEHADGLSRSSFIRQQYGPLADVFRDIKQIFDPLNIFNPGKVVSDDPHLLTSNLRPTGISLLAKPIDEPVTPPETLPDPTSVTAKPVVLQLNWSLDELSQTARSCNGCGACRSQQAEVRMCPIFRYGPAEESSPRAKANLMRGILSGQLDPTTLDKDDFKAVADLCVNCHMCRQECPASVDIPKLMTEGKGFYVRTNGLTTSDWAMANIDLLSRWGSLLSPLANWTLGNRWARWLLEKTLGIAQGRKLPRVASRSFLRVAARRKLTRPSRRTGLKVLYFVDTYANYHDLQLAEALVAILEHNAVGVYVHPLQRPSGMPFISHGALGRARRLAEQNVTLLAEAVRLGYHIVTTEPSAALCLTHEYLSLVDDDDARLVADNSSEACEYLWKLHESGKMQLDFRPVHATLGYHMPCHLKALNVGSPGESLLRLVPGLVVNRIERGCSGMAGTFGLQRKNFRASLRAGRGLITGLRDPRLQAGATECSTCKLQMEQGAAKPTLHPLKLLALSYGLMPEVADLLAARDEEFLLP